MSRTYEQLEPVISALDKRIKTNLGAFPTDTAEGSIVSFPDGADDIPLKSLVVDINPVQDTSSGDPSPTNICPISGRTEVNVEQRGVNVWDEEWELGTYNTTTGAKENNANIRCKNFIAVLPSTTYFINASANTSAYLKPLFYDSDYSYIGTVDSLRNATLSTPANACYMTFYMNTSYGTTYNNDISINYPSTDHDYHAYTGQTIPIDWQTEAGTVYGGKLDVLSGVLTVDRAMVDLGTLNWDKNNSLNLFYTNIPDAKYAASAKGRPSICSALASAYNATWADWSNFPDYSIAVGNNYATGFYNTIVKVTEYTDVASFKQMLTDTNARLVYELATPIEIQLSPNQVNSLLGVNNLWADSGDTEVEYRADTKLFIERLTAPDSADMIADANITSGQYFMVGNTLYKATANIASGSAVIEGTNATRKSLSEALNEINS